MRLLLQFLILLLVAPAIADTVLPISGVDVIKGEQAATADSVEQNQVVIFLSAKCPCSNSHVAELKKLVTDYPDVNFVGVHSNVDESPEVTKAYFEKIALPFPVIQDTKNEIADRLKASKTPHAYVISRNEIVYRGGVSDRKNLGPDNRLYLREALEDLKQQRPLRTPEARTLGCAIPRS